MAHIVGDAYVKFIDDTTYMNVLAHYAYHIRTSYMTMKHLVYNKSFKSLVTRVHSS